MSFSAFNISRQLAGALPALDVLTFHSPWNIYRLDDGSLVFLEDGEHHDGVQIRFRVDVLRAGHPEWEAWLNENDCAAEAGGQRMRRFMARAQGVIAVKAITSGIGKNKGGSTKSKALARMVAKQPFLARAISDLNRGSDLDPEEIQQALEHAIESGALDISELVDTSRETGNDQLRPGVASVLLRGLAIEENRCDGWTTIAQADASQRLDWLAVPEGAPDLPESVWRGGQPFGDAAMDFVFQCAVRHQETADLYVEGTEKNLSDTSGGSPATGTA